MKLMDILFRETTLLGHKDKCNKLLMYVPTVLNSETATSLSIKYKLIIN